MNISFHKKFEKGFARLTPELKKKATECILLFINEPFHPQLRNHQLKGRLSGLRAFYITQSVRVVFEEHNDYTVVIMIDVGKHERVYR